MAKPDLDDGYLRIAHELFAALACAGFSKWEMVVLREVFDQIYGPRKAKTAALPLSEIAARVGTYKQSIYRAIQGLTDAGVLVRNAEGEYRFIKDYDRWRLGEKARFSPSETTYCAAAKRTKSSKSVVNNGAYEPSSAALTPSAPALTESKQRRLPASSAALTPVSAGAYAADIEDRARSEKGEKKEEGGKNAPPPPLRPSSIPDDPISRQCLQLAIDRWGASNGDVVVGDLLKTFRPPVVRYAIDQVWDKHGADLRPSYLRGICRDVDLKGIPVRKGELNGRTAVTQPEAETRAPIRSRTNFDELPDTPETRAVRAMWEGKAS